MYNIAFITTFAEIISNELVGTEVIDPVTKKSLGFRKGTLASVAEEIAGKETDFAKKFNLTCIIVNDDEDVVRGHWEKKEGYNPDLSITIPGDSSTKTLKEITQIIPSSVWRGIPIPKRGSPNRAEVIAKRKELKVEYEGRIVKALQDADVDILVSNSYTNIIGPRLLGEFKDRIINIHPAITAHDNPARLPGVTPTRDAYTRSTEGFVIVDDKKSVSLEGEKATVAHEGKEREAVLIDEKYRFTHGVTVHVITAGVDEGPPILTETYDMRDHFNINGANPNKPLLTEEIIRDFNYKMKPSVFISAIMKYVNEDNVQKLIDEKRKQRLTTE